MKALSIMLMLLVTVKVIMNSYLVILWLAAILPTFLISNYRDYDQEDAIPSDDDFIGGIYFAPFTEDNKTSVYVSDLNNSINYEVFLSYEW